MKVFLWSSMLLLFFGAVGIGFNVYTGLFLSREMAADSDFHLITALSSVALLVAGSLGLTRASRNCLELAQERILLSKNEDQSSLVGLQQARSLAVTRSLFMVVCCVINLISGTISQTGRFPLVHGLFGFLLAAVVLAALLAWFQFISRLLGLSSVKTGVQ